MTWFAMRFDRPVNPTPALSSSAWRAHMSRMSSTIAAGQWDLDVGTGILNLCPRSRKMFGLPPYSARPLREEEWVLGIHPDDWMIIRCALQASLVDGTIYAQRFRAIRPDGSIREIFGVGRGVDDRADGARLVGWNVDVLSSAYLAGGGGWSQVHAPEGIDLVDDTKSSGVERISAVPAEQEGEALSEPEPLLARAEEMLRVRRAGGQLLGHAMLKDPAFDLFLVLYVLSARQETVSLSCLAKVAGIPGTSAWRWLGYLVDKGFVVRCPSTTDRRAMSASLTDAGRAVFNEFLATP
jgi:DNA-binding MarR family transcriptional regulator